MSLSARRAWIEIDIPPNLDADHAVALRKESVDRNQSPVSLDPAHIVALRKESVDRNTIISQTVSEIIGSLSARRAWIEIKALQGFFYVLLTSLSARRAWIEMANALPITSPTTVALRKESVDRNAGQYTRYVRVLSSLSARRAWIEILVAITPSNFSNGRSPQGERG